MHKGKTVAITTTMTRLTTLAVFVGILGTAGIATLSQCSSSGVGAVRDGGMAVAQPETGIGALTLPDAGAGNDTGCTPDIATLVAAEVTGWQGWRPLTQLSPCCAAAVPVDAAASMPPYA